MTTKFVPILRWKTGEKECLENLSSQVAESIIPFVEVPTLSDSSSDESAQKKYAKLIKSFNEVWKGKPFYLYLTEDWYQDIDSPDQIYELYNEFYNSIGYSTAIPSFDVSDEINISSFYKNSNGICLRITGNNFESIGNTLDSYIKNAWINPQSTDLLFDLKYIDEDIYPKKAALTTALSDILNISEFRRVIISSCSFPKDISKVQGNVVNEFTRLEAKIHDISLKLQKTYSFNYIYSDYGSTNLNEATFIVGMIPNFKIKYTTPEKYLVVKGLSLKKGGLDLVNVSNSCKLLINHPNFSGSVFSYGDKIIYDTANGNNVKSGNLTKWVGYSLNHHITLIVSIL